MNKNTEPSPKPHGEPSSIAMAMLALASHEPNRPAFCIPRKNEVNVAGFAEDGVEWLSWAKIAKLVADACDAIAATQQPPGTHLATFEKNGLQWIVLDLACQVMGYVHVAIDHRWPDPMVARLIEHSDSTLVYSQRFNALSPFAALNNVIPLRWQLNWNASSATDDEITWLKEKSQSISGCEPAQMLFTSGTSGEPKGVLLSHRNLVSNAYAKLTAAPQYEKDLRLNILPFCHAYARTCELSTWILSKSQLAIASDWSDFLQQAKSLQPTLINLVPHLANKLLHRETTQQPLAPTEVLPRLGGKVRLLQVGGAPIADELWFKLDASGLPPLQGYGLTEASPVVCSNRSGEQRPGTIGPPVAGVELRVDAAEQLWVRGDGVMLGYYGDPVATQSRIQDGWLATGDLVECDEYGHYRLKGRISEFMVLSTGHKVSPELIEGRLQEIPWIDRALLAGENAPYVVALIWPAWQALPANVFADDSRDPSSLDELVLQQMLADSVCGVLAEQQDYLRPRKFIVISDPIDSSLLTPKGSLRRKVAISRFRKQIEHAYMGTSNICDSGTK